MASVRSGFKRFTAWIKRKEPPEGPGPGGSPYSRSFEEARALGEIHRAQGSWGGGSV